MTRPWPERMDLYRLYLMQIEGRLNRQLSENDYSRGVFVWSNGEVISSSNCERIHSDEGNHIV